MEEIGGGMGITNKVEFRAGNEYYSEFIPMGLRIRFKILESGKIEVKILKCNKDHNYISYNSYGEIECLDFGPLSMGIDKYYVSYSTLYYSLGKKDSIKNGLDTFTGQLTISEIERVGEAEFHLVMRTTKDPEWIKII